jgi:hypothetical protein
MNVQCTSKLQRFNLSLIFTLTIAITAPSVFAKNLDATIDIRPLRYDGQFVSSPSTFQHIENWAPLGTHDSGALPTPAPPVLIAKANLLRQHEKTATRVIVDQVAEPFIAVGSFTPNSLKAMPARNAWKMAFKLAAPTRSTAHRPPLDLQLQELAQEEPIDIESLGPSVLIPENRPMSVTGIEVAPINPLIGSSPVIATIEEDYMPYDLSARDLENWNAYPIESHPFNAEDRVTDEQTASLWDDFDIAMALSRSTDPVELNGIANATLEASSSTVKSPSSPSDLAMARKTPSVPAKYQASQRSNDVNADSIPLPIQEESAITSDEALAILSRPESLSLTPAPENMSTPATREAAGSETNEKVSGTTKADPADVALEAIIDNLPVVEAFNTTAGVKNIGTIVGRLIGSTTGSSSHWIGKRVADIALNWPASDQLKLPSRVGAKLLSRASVLESGVIEENTIATYIPVERLDGVDCGGQAAIVVADANRKSKAR